MCGRLAQRVRMLSTYGAKHPHQNKKISFINQGMVQDRLKESF
jgi:hypothetical protein